MFIEFADQSDFGVCGGVVDCKFRSARAPSDQKCTLDKVPNSEVDEGKSPN